LGPRCICLQFAALVLAPSRSRPCVWRHVSGAVCLASLVKSATGVCACVRSGRLVGGGHRSSPVSPPPFRHTRWQWCRAGVARLR
jgi:hypothetical protein